MLRTVHLNLGSFDLKGIAPPTVNKGSIVQGECNWHVGKSIETEELINKNAIIVFLLNEDKIPFALDLCLDISNICNSRQMYPYVVTTTDLERWYRSGLQTIMVPTVEQVPRDLVQLLAPDITAEISEFISAFGGDVCTHSKTRIQCNSAPEASFQQPKSNAI